MRILGVGGLGVAVLLIGALLRGWLVPASQGGLSPEAYGWRLRLPWAAREEVVIAFPVEGGKVWGTVRRAVPEATPLAAVRELVAGPVPGSGLQPIFTPGARVTGVAIANGVARVTIEGWDPPAHDPSIPRALRAVARALAGHAKEAEIEIPSETLGPVMVPEAAGDQVSYLWRGAPVRVPAELPAGEGRAEAAVQRLFAGPVPDGVEGMPSGIGLLGVEVKGDLAKVSLSLSPALTQELVAGRWQFAPYAMSMLYTLTDQPGIKRVQFEIPNLPAEAKRNCRTPLGRPMVRPDAEKSRAKGA